MRTKTSAIYNNLIFFLLLHCALQDFVIPIVYKMTGSLAVGNLLFYLKDVLLLVLFVWAVVGRKVPPRMLKVSMIYLLLIAILVVVTLSGGQIPLSQVLANTRNVILLPCLCCIGGGISDKEKFEKCLVGFWFPFVTCMVVIGVIEYALDFVVGTKNFWTDVIGYTDFYVDIKKQFGNMNSLYGLPVNFYGSYGGDSFSVKRLVGLWANPLTSAYSMFPAGIYYFLKCYKGIDIRNVRRQDIVHLCSFAVILAGIYFSHTRAILLVFGLVIGGYLAVREKQNPFLYTVLLMGLVAVLLLVDVASASRFWYDGSTMGHIMSITNTISQAKPSLFGHGLAYIGIYGMGQATESAYLSLAGNTGLVGAGLYIYLLGDSVVCVKRGAERDLPAAVVFYSGIGYILTGIISEQLFAFTTIAQFYLLLGAVNKIQYLSRAEYENWN